MLLLIVKITLKVGVDDPSYIEIDFSLLGVVKYAEKYSDFVIGFISQSRLVKNEKYLHCTPGKSMEILSQNEIDGCLFFMKGFI